MRLCVLLCVLGCQAEVAGVDEETAALKKPRDMTVVDVARPLRQIDFYVVFFSADATRIAEADSFYSCLSQSSTFGSDWARQYGFGPIVYHGAYVLDIPAPKTLYLGGGSPVEQTLQHAFDCGQLPQPGSSNTVYIVYSPTGTTDTYSDGNGVGGQLCRDTAAQLWCGYHSAQSYNGNTYQAALIPLDCTLQACNGFFSWIGEHELGEAMGNFAGAGFETGDNCEAVHNRYNLRCCDSDYLIQKMSRRTDAGACDRIEASAGSCATPGLFAGRNLGRDSAGKLDELERLPDLTTQLSRETGADDDGYLAWRPLAGSFEQPPVVTRSADGRLELFAVGPDAALQRRSQTAWTATNTCADFESAWTRYDGPAIASRPVLGRDADGHSSVIVRRADGTLWMRDESLTGGTWSDWESIGAPPANPLTGNPAVALNTDGSLAVFARDRNGGLWHAERSNQAWGAWSAIPGAAIFSDPAVRPNVDGRLDVFGAGTDGTLWHAAQSRFSGPWENWASLGTALMVGTPAISRHLDGRLEVFARLMDETLFRLAESGHGRSWSAPETLTGLSVITDPDIATREHGLFELFAAGHDGTLSHRHELSAGSWSDWNPFFGATMWPDAFWHFDDCTPGVALVDSSGNAHDAVATGGVTCASGRHGTDHAIALDGTTGVALMQDGAELHYYQSMTMAAWINPSAGDHTILEKPGSFTLALAGGQLQATVVGTASTAFSASGWSHVAAVYDGSNLILYVDGVRKATLPASGAIGDSAQPMCIGGCTNHFAGSIDDVWLSRQALSDDQIQLLARGAILPGACLPTSSLTVLVKDHNVTAYIPNGSWSESGTGVQVVPIEGSAARATIPTTQAINSCAANSVTGEVVCVANDAHVYTVMGTTLTGTYTSSAADFEYFSGGDCMNCGVTVDPSTNRAAVALGVSAGHGGYQFFNLADHKFDSVISAGSNQTSEDIVIDTQRQLLLSPNEDGDYQLVNASTGAVFDLPFGNSYEFDSAGEDCTTGIALATIEFSNQLLLVDLTQASFAGGAWSAAHNFETFREFSQLSAGTSGVAVAPGAHLAFVAGEFGGNAFGVVALPSASGSGTPAAKDYVQAWLPNTPDGLAWNNGLDPHTLTAYVSPADGKAYALLSNESRTWVAVVDMQGVLDATRTPSTHSAPDVGKTVRFISIH